MMEALYKDTTSAVLINNEIEPHFRTAVGVRQGCILSPTLFNIFLEKIMEEIPNNHRPSMSVGGRCVCNLRFADDINLMAGSEE